MSLLLALTAGGGGYTLSAATGTYNVSGASANILRGYTLVASSGSYVVTGQSATITRSRVLTAESGVYDVSGNSANIVYTPTGASYTLTANSGVYNVSGQNATITFTGGATDTHDGFWRKQWEEIAKQSKATKKLEKKKKAIEANDLPIVELVKETHVIETVKPIKAKSNSLIVDRVIEFNYDANDEDEDLLMLW